MPLNPRKKKYLSYTQSNPVVYINMNTVKFGQYLLQVQVKLMKVYCKQIKSDLTIHSSTISIIFFLKFAHIIYKRDCLLYYQNNEAFK